MSARGIYVRMDDRERAKQALLSAVAAMQLHEDAQALVLCAIVILRLARCVPKEKPLAIVDAFIERRKAEASGA